jgi:uncharacterized protein (DUF58 family)
MPIQHDKIKELSHLEFLAKQVVEGFITGLHKSPFHGFSVEFAEHRLYNSGESTRHIDWKLFARSDKLFVKRYEEETNLRCHIVVDCSSSMFYPEKERSEQLNKFDFSINAAAAMIELLRRQRDAVGISLFADTVKLHTQEKSSYSHIKMLYNALEKAAAEGKPQHTPSTDIAGVLHQVAESIHKRSLVVLFTDFFETQKSLEDLIGALQHLRHNKHEVIIFKVNHKKSEINFDLKNNPYIFTDLETGEELKLLPNQVKEQYLESIKQLNHTLHEKCGQYRIDLVECDIDEGYNHVLLQYLVKRSRLL